MRRGVSVPGSDLVGRFAVHADVEAFAFRVMVHAQAAQATGDVEGDDMRQPKRLRVVQYRRGDVNMLRVGYNRAFGSPPLNLSATLKDDEVLHVDGRRFGVRKELPEKALQRIRNACIQPALAEPKRPSKEEAAEIAAGTATSVKPPPLVPVKTFYLPLTAIQGAPYFPADR